MIISQKTANVLALCFYGVDPLESKSQQPAARMTTIKAFIDHGAIEADGRTLTDKGLFILQEHVSSGRA